MDWRIGSLCRMMHRSNLDWWTGGVVAIYESWQGVKDRTAVQEEAQAKHGSVDRQSRRGITSVGQEWWTWIPAWLGAGKTGTVQEYDGKSRQAILANSNDQHSPKAFSKSSP